MALVRRCLFTNPANNFKTYSNSFLEISKGIYVLKCFKIPLSNLISLKIKCLRWTLNRGSNFCKNESFRYEIDIISNLAEYLEEKLSQFNRQCWQPPVGSLSVIENAFHRKVRQKSKYQSITNVTRKTKKNSNKSVTNFRNRMVIEKNGGPTHRRSQRNPQILLDSSGGLVYKAVWTGLKSFDLGSQTQIWN